MKKEYIDNLEKYGIWFRENDELKKHVLPFKGDHNFRDLGGFVTKDGRKIKKGYFFRSGATYKLTDASDIKLLKELGLKAIFDLRSKQEADAEPDIEIEGCTNYRITAMRYEDGSELDFSPEGIIRLENEIQNFEKDHPGGNYFIVLYRNIPFKNDAYKKMFQFMAKERKPFLFHCTAGKDRTGIAAYLILRALGVDEDEIIEDYMYTNVCRESYLVDLYEKNLNTIREHPELMMSLVGFAAVSLEQIVAVKDCIYEKYGDNFNAYLFDEYGIDEDQLKELRDYYLE